MSLTNDIIGLRDGRTMLVHPPTACERTPCCVHNPSAHPLSAAQLSWNAFTRSMERTCQHGRGHPDPDDLAYKRSVLGAEFARHFAFHDCCGWRCCRSVTP